MKRLFTIHPHATLAGYIATLIGFLIYSFSLMDPNLTLINHPVWTSFRNTMVHFGFLNRPDSWGTYLVLVSLLFVFHQLFLWHKHTLSPLKIALITGAILLFSYPLLSHDLFNYIFDAKIFTVYGKNPYQAIPANFSEDEWLRFMHWIHRPYPYGPTFLPITIVVSFMTLGKFILNYILFKALFVASYIGSVFILQKMKRSWALFFATSPIILVEGLINAHNDLLAVFFGIFGIYMLTKHGVLARLSFLISGGIKYFTLPTILLQKPVEEGRQHVLTILGALGICVLIVYVSITSAIQAWYALNLFVLIPYYFDELKKMHITFYGMLLANFPIIRYGVWEVEPGVNIKNIIVFSAIGLNVLWIVGHTHYRRVRSGSSAA